MFKSQMKGFILINLKVSISISEKIVNSLKRLKIALK